MKINHREQDHAMMIMMTIIILVDASCSWTASWGTEIYFLIIVKAVFWHVLFTSMRCDWRHSNICLRVQHSRNRF